jgi:asparagine synthase (glutamine-hydrolysing)
MCGITGIVYNKALEDTHDIKAMSDAISHRGPDGEGFLAVNTLTGGATALGGVRTPISLPPLVDFGARANMYLAHRRLSIIDLTTAGHQPMSNKQKNIWIIFNGEIYNYKTLKNELKEYDFKSNTDTEVLLYAYEKWGMDCLRRFNGMWAFVIYDARKNILFGSRDRFGVKPLYFTNNTNFFAFSSEIKGLLAKSEVSHKVNMDASCAYLRLGMDSFGCETFFREISELEPAHYFIYDLEKKEIIVKRYYELAFYDQWEVFNAEKAVKYIEETRERVLHAVDLRLNADVTVGSCLSGGMDSSAIVCSIDRLLKERSYNSIGPKQKVVTACYNNSLIDESKWANMIAGYVGADWHRVFPQRQELIDDLYDLIYTQDVPFGSTSIYAQYRVMKAAKEAGIIVMLDGQGGDELFTGYTPYYYMFYSEAAKNKDFNLLKVEQRHIGNTPLGNINILKNVIKYNVKSTITNIYRRTTGKQLGGSVLRQPETKYISVSGKSYGQYTYSTLNQMLYVLVSYTSLPRLLKFEDRNSMRFSIESRTPFADDIELIEYIFKIPGIYKIHQGWSKYLLRQAMDKVVPEQIIKRTDKIGFETPEYEWLQSLKTFIFDDNNDLYISEIINMRQLEKDWDKIITRHNKTGIANIWRYINFILWFKIFGVTI